MKRNFLEITKARECLGRLKTRTPQEARALAIGAGVSPQVVETIAKEAARLSIVFPSPGSSGNKPPSASAPGGKPPLTSPGHDRSAASGERRTPAGGTPQEVIPGYKFLKKVGVGGTSTVFLAESSASGDGRAAVKILHPKKAQDPLQRDRFLREARLLTEFDHPNIVKGYAFGTHGPLHYFAMEYIDGTSVQDEIDRNGTVDETRALEMILDVARGLEYLHSRGYVHKDIKPGNIMLTSDRRVKLCDLGFAEALGSSSSDQETTLGTVQFMSPEQAQGKCDLDIRSDIYSLGATLFYMVMGELPFKGDSDMDLMAKQVMEELDSAGLKNRRLSQHMHYFVERMMSKDRDLRYSSASDMIQDITQQIEGFRRVINAVSIPPSRPASDRFRRFKPKA